MQMSVFPFVCHPPYSTAFETYKWCCEIKLNRVGRRKRIWKKALIRCGAVRDWPHVVWYQSYQGKYNKEKLWINWVSLKNYFFLCISDFCWMLHHFSKLILYLNIVCDVIADKKLTTVCIPKDFSVPWKGMLW